MRVNSRVVWMASWQVERGDRIAVEGRVDARPEGPIAFDPAWFVADDGDIVVVDKPSGLRSEAVRATDASANLLTLARAALGDDLVLAHRLDRDTSGLVMMTRPGPVRAALDEMFSTHKIAKRYVALVRNTPLLLDAGRLTNFLAPDKTRRDAVVVVAKGGKKADTDYRVLTQTDLSARVELHPLTGRTHQLRVQCAHINAPILGDRLYGDAASADRLMLHAASLELPATSNRPARRFESPVPF